jgi:Flp pilus assembly protein TadD
MFSAAAGQDDETRAASGLPMLIGEHRVNVSGRIKIEDAGKLAKKPVVSVTATFASTTPQRTTTNEEGYFVIRGVPREAFLFVVEVDGIEMIREQVPAAVLGVRRFDYTIPAEAIMGVSTRTAVVVAPDDYARPESNKPIFEQAAAAAKGGDTAKAVQLFDKVLAADPKDYPAWTELGSVYFRTDSFDNAEAAYFKAIELKRDYSLALLNLGKLYLARKQFDNAILVLSNAVKASPSSAETHHYLAESYLQAKKGSSAVFHFNEAIRLAPAEKAELHLRLASLYDAANIKDKAAAEFRLFLDKNPNYAEKAKLEKYIKENGTAKK